MNLELYIISIIVVFVAYMLKCMLDDEEQKQRERERCGKCPFECDKYREEKGDR